MAVAELAETQHGVVSRRQLLRDGMSDAAVDHGIAARRLFPIFRGVFCVGHREVGVLGRMLAAVLACDEESVVSHGTAAVLLGLWDIQPRSVDVIAPVERGRRIDDIRRRHVPPPRGRQRWTIEGIPCTSPSRTIVDLAASLREEGLRRLVEKAAVAGLLDVAAIDAVLAGPRRRGSRQLRRVLEDWWDHTPGVRLRSPLEARLRAMLTRRALPTPSCNAPLFLGGERLEVDFLWKRQRLVVETDGARYHDNPAARRRDRHRDEVLTGAGYRVLRLRAADLSERPEASLNEIARLLGHPAPSAVP